jgi:UDP-N-acetylglucosamine/UDP-N-acetyl-alpha-D-glucosaminouronate 4-epimerase
MGERALVTGGGGFIGHHLVRRLVADGHDVRVLDNFSTGRRERLEGLDVGLVEGDLRSYERANTAVRGTDVVFHLGALPSVPRSVQDPLTTSAVNVEGTLNVLLAARDEDVRRVVFASSSSVYGASPGLPKTESDQPLPISPYGVSKVAAEHYCRTFTTVYGLEAVSLRLFNVFGPGQDPLSQYAAVVPRFIAAFGSGNRPIVYGDGKQTRDFTYVDDVVEAFVLAAAAPAATGEVINVCAGRETSLLALLGDPLRAPRARTRIRSPSPRVRRSPGEPRGSQRGPRAAGLGASVVPSRRITRLDPGTPQFGPTLSGTPA